MAVRTTLDRAWDAFDVYLFDIDGTLIHCSDAVHYFAFCDALTSVAGKPVNLDGVTAHGNTDRGILRDAFVRAGVPESRWRPSLDGACDAMSKQVEQNSHQLCVTTLPSVERVLDHLKVKGARLGVATGNLERIGRRKLDAARLLERFHFGGWSDSLESRGEVFARAVQKAAALAGADATMVVVGDTPADIRAARANRLPVIAVATGVYSYAELEAESPDLCIHSMDELFASA